MRRAEVGMIRRETRAIMKNAQVDINRRKRRDDPFCLDDDTAAGASALVDHPKSPGGHWRPRGRHAQYESH